MITMVWAKKKKVLTELGTTNVSLSCDYIKAKMCI